MGAKICWITGASSGIGAAVAQELARAGYVVAASARSADRLAALAAGNYGDGRIVSCPLDVTDRGAVETAIHAIVAQQGGIDLAILCAGNYIPDHAVGFDAAGIQSQFQLNVMGVAYALETLLPLMQRRPGSHIAIVASVAGYRGLPRAVGYGGTKAALINMTEALKPDCDALGIKLQLICPGFVKTPLTDKNEFPMPFLITVDEAAKAIVDGLAAERFEIVFPWRMKLAMKLLRALPYGLFFPLVKKMTGAGKP